MTVLHYELSREAFEKSLAEAMEATVEALVKDGVLTVNDATAFVETHTAVILSQNAITRRLSKLFGFTSADDKTCRIAIAKVRRENSA